MKKTKKPCMVDGDMLLRKIAKWQIKDTLRREPEFIEKFVFESTKLDLYNLVLVEVSKARMGENETADISGSR